jgi:hypothetical protein
MIIMRCKKIIPYGLRYESKKLSEKEKDVTWYIKEGHNDNWSDIGVMLYIFLFLHVVTVLLNHY